jgi:hypothetical protein
MSLRFLLTPTFHSFPSQGQSTQSSEIECSLLFYVSMLFCVVCGQTTHHLHTWVSEHLGITPLTGKQCKSPSMSNIFSHLTSTGHTASVDDFKILSSCPPIQELLLPESVISKIKPNIDSKARLSPFTYFNSPFTSFSLVFPSFPLIFLLYIPSPHTISILIPISSLRFTYIVIWYAVNSFTHIFITAL